MEWEEDFCGGGAIRRHQRESGLCWGRTHSSVWSPPLHAPVCTGCWPWCPVPAAASNPPAQGEHQQMWGQKKQQKQLSCSGYSAQFRFPCYLAFPLQGAGLPGSPTMPCSSAPMSPGRAACWRTASLPVGRACYLCVAFWSLCKTTKTHERSLSVLMLH